MHFLKDDDVIFLLLWKLMLNTLCIFGTRPEAIKMAPLILELNKNSTICNKICVTAQHQQMLESVLNLFQIIPDYNLQVMTPNQNLTTLTVKILTGLAELFKTYKPDFVLVHGDTTTTLAASLSAYYHKIPIIHIEAGLRTGNINLPWPEEGNRKLTASLALAHCAPTESARVNLIKESVPNENIFVTGNTVIDALKIMVKKIDDDSLLSNQLKQQFSFLTPDRHFLLVTGHRRESFGEGFERICCALAEIAKRFPEIDIVYPVHLNPSVQQPVKLLLEGISNVYLIDPVDYLSFVYLMKSAHIILTDSGGIQEEAPFLGKPVLVMRDITERPEALDVGSVRLVGTTVEKIVNTVQQLLTNKHLYHKMSVSCNSYGDGNASKRIVQIILNLANSTIGETTLINTNFLEENA